ncbi:DUF2480 family protein [Salinibacter altiplanensis]|uniref:DUF2480 family protein n=1 Tax=Salinibacter altiplanensis TaxID=1803181 RepID=UPI000C9F465E|nr:DUF2480 family protein [Salinibacter altiplanensis]
MESIENRVAQGEIEVYNLADLWDDRPVTELDISAFLVDGLMLKEKEFRAEVDAHDWSQYANEHVALHCSTDAIVPTWGYMLIASELHDVAQSTTIGRADDLRREYYVAALDAEDWSAYEDTPVVVKGCGDDEVPEMAYVRATQKLQDVARKLMYGEPCSSVPLWRRPQDNSPTPDAEAVGVKKPDLPTPNAE